MLVSLTIMTLFQMSSSYYIQTLVSINPQFPSDMDKRFVSIFPIYTAPTLSLNGGRMEPPVLQHECKYISIYKVTYKMSIFPNL